MRTWRKHAFFVSRLLSRTQKINGSTVTVCPQMCLSVLGLILCPVDKIKASHQLLTHSVTSNIRGHRQCRKPWVNEGWSECVLLTRAQPCQEPQSFRAVFRSMAKPPSWEVKRRGKRTMPSSVSECECAKKCSPLLSFHQWLSPEWRLLSYRDGSCWD